LQYLVADTIAQAIALIANGGVPLAGGTTLVPRIQNETPPDTIVDITKIGDLRTVQNSGKVIQLGAVVTLEQAAETLSAHRSLGAALAAVRTIGNPHIRRLATLGGNICADKEKQTGDLTTALLALDGRVTVAHTEGLDEMAIGAFLVNGGPGPRLVTKIAIPIDPERRSSFAKFAWRQTSAPAVLSAAAAARVVGGRLYEARIAIGATTKIVDRDTGEVLMGRVPAYSVVVPGSLPGKNLPDGRPGPSLYCAVIVKKVDEGTRARTSINELLRE